MQTLILAGGKGKRLQPYTTVIPKPLMPVGDYPILEVVLSQLKNAGVTSVILAVGHMSQLFKSFFGNGERFGLDISYTFEEKPLGTAGSIASVIGQMNDDFIVMNGDLLTTLDFCKLYAFHKQSDAAATISVFPKDVKIDFGIIERDKNNMLSKYIEKPTYSFEVSMGINVINPEKVKPYLVSGEYLDMPDLMIKLSSGGQKVCCYPANCRWLDIGRIQDYEIATAEFQDNLDLYLPNKK